VDGIAVLKMSRGHKAIIHHSSVTSTQALVHLLLLLLLHTTLANRVPGNAHHHGNDDDTDDHYVIAGDIMLGVILSIHEHVQEKACGEKLRESGVVQQVEAIVYAVKEINEAYPPLLPAGLKLGAVILDDCAKPEIALARALHFLPIAGDVEQRPSRVSALSHKGLAFSAAGAVEVENNSSPLPTSVHQQIDVKMAPPNGILSNETQRPQGPVVNDNGEDFVDLGGLHIKQDSISRPMEHFYDVVGVIGAESSSSSIMVSNLLGKFGIPLIR